MFLFCTSALVLATCLGSVTSFYNAEICSVVKESSGPIPPPIPTNFELRSEHVDHNNKYVIYEELYFDYSNSRGKYMYLSRGIEHHYLFDYDVLQVVQYDILHPGVNIKKDPMSHVCTAVDMEDSEYEGIFGSLQGDMGGKPKMFNSNQVLGFGGIYLYRFLESIRMEHRGLLVDKFIGCVYNDFLDATINSTFLFTSKKNYGVGTAAGTTEEEVTGIENGLLSVPVRADIFGSMPDPKDADTPITFNRTINYFWFKGNPEFKPRTFQLPPFLYCSDYRGRKDMKAFPTAFQARYQVTKMERDILGKLATTESVGGETVFYDKDRKLARSDFTPSAEVDTDIKSKFQNLNPIREVYDFNIGLLYVTNIPSGRCFIRPIDHGDLFESSNDALYIVMATPEEVFQMQTDKLEYKGTDFTRDIECDVWAGEHFDKKLNATYAMETYMSTNGWHEEADELPEYGVPIKHTLIQKELNGELVEGVRTYNFFKFKAKAPLLKSFDVSNCIEKENHKDFVILLTISEATKKLLIDYRVQFLDVAQAYITEMTQLLTPLRVQRLQLRTVSKANPRPVLLVTLVDKINLKTKVPIAQRGPSLAEAVAKLHIYIETNQFAIQFQAPNSKEVTLVPALRGSLYVKTSSGDLNYYSPVSKPEIMHDNPLDFEEENKGMTSGSLALLGAAMLFIGIGIGVAIMYLYIRMNRSSLMEDRIHLTINKKEEDVRIEVPSISGIAENSQ